MTSSSFLMIITQDEEILDFLAKKPHYSDMGRRITTDGLFPNDEHPCEVAIDHLPHGCDLHSHDFVEVVIVLDGTADHQIDDQVYPVSAGVVSVLHGQSQHCFFHATPDFTVCKIIYRTDTPWVPHEHFKTLPGYQALFVLEPFRRKQHEFPSCLRLNGAMLHEVLGLTQHLQDELQSRSQGYQYMAQGYLLQLIVLLSRCYARLRGEEPAGLLRLSEAVIYLEEHYLEDLKIGDIAAKAQLSERHFVRLFHMTFHVSPSERILHLRINHARRLLESGNLNVTETAYTSGFHDSNYFSRQFRRLVGCTPREYRRRVSTVTD
ncbi:MAG TPA: AraC family transcriptional regulator [Armatimonadota bacterium]|nr:AraC family transcriptional regulator [Armatimonadota bacterium]